MQIRFDRGTIVIDRGRDAFDPLQLPGVVWDPRTSAWRAPADAYTDVIARLADDGVRVADPAPDHRTAASWAGPPLRWYQRDAIAAWSAAGHRGVIALPTGAGKTIVATATIARLGVSALCLVPTRVLLDQWANAIEHHLGHAGRLGDGEHRIAPITVATYASAIGWAPRIGDRFGLVVVDEAHHVGGTCPREVLEMLIAPARLGLTATPPVGDGALALERAVGPVVYTLGIDDLVGDALAEFDVVPVKIELTSAERARYHAARTTFASAFSAYQRAAPGAGWDAFVRAAMRSEHGRAALAAWRTSCAILAYPDGKRAALRELLARHAGTRALVFTSDNPTAYAIARELLVFPITHEIGRAERAAVLRRFRAGDATVLVSAQVLDEGFDVPDAEIAIIVGGSASGRRHVQRIGRVLRPSPDKRARIYELTVQATIEVARARTRQLALVGVSLAVAP